MDIRDIRIRKKQLEEVIQSEIMKFEEETKLSISDVSLEKIEKSDNAGIIKLKRLSIKCEI